ncbi:hypothetical protein RZS28_14950 [Methylocapsa polymorpha]|uniref:Transmembrane anti-sigma factor n=1 Tax=Methylocapsa polymorpha TaxID=3080828 RepID=A0ABZ0HR07_9HYPH|nr:hypothetical protein RZS28_14950 [Methylocapsa sp. RX1]
MTGSLPPVSDEDLHGFVDGEVEPARRDAILRFLSASPADAARVESWRRQNETIRAAFARVEAEHVPSFLSFAPPESRSRFPCKLLSGQERFAAGGKAEGGGAANAPWRYRQACLLLLAFASGIIATIGATLLADRINAPDRALIARSDHLPAPVDSDSIFVGRTVAALQSFAPQASTATTKPAAAISDKAAVGQRQTALVLPNLSGAGLRLAGLRVLPSETDRMFCFFYTKPTDVSLALCVERAADAGASGFHQVGHFPSSTIDWRQMGARYALAGALADAELRTLAGQASAEIEAFDAR